MRGERKRVYIHIHKNLGGGSVHLCVVDFVTTVSFTTTLVHRCCSSTPRNKRAATQLGMYSPLADSFNKTACVCVCV